MERAVFDSTMANKYYWIRPRLNLIRQRPQNHHSSGCKEDKAPSLLVVCQTKAFRGHGSSRTPEMNPNTQKTTRAVYNDDEPNISWQYTGLQRHVQQRARETLRRARESN
jgi:hypothetical protein